MPDNVTTLIKNKDLFEAEKQIKSSLNRKASTILKEMYESVAEGYRVKEEGDKDSDEYKAFFKKAMKKFGVTEPDQLKGDKKKEFFDYVDKNWTADHEESVEEGTNPEIDKISKAIKGKSMMDIRSDLESMFGKKNIDYSHSPMPHWLIKAKGKKIMIVNKKYADSPDAVVGGLAIGVIN
jgi:hypothetical protein